MSHFTVLVLGDNVDEQLAPYDENARVDPYLDSEKDDWEETLINARESILQEPGGLSAGVPAPAPDAPDQTVLDWYSGRGVWIPRQDRAGFDRYSTYNPSSKWDWYSTGGRWDGMLITKSGEHVNECLIEELDVEETFKPDDEGVTYTTFALVKDGQWHEKGQMGWWAMTANEKDGEEWNAEVFKALAEAPPGTKVTLIDAHI